MTDPHDDPAPEQPPTERLATPAGTGPVVGEPSAPVTEPRAGTDLPGASGDVPVPATEDLPWRRLDRRMLLIHPFQALVRALPALVVLFFARSGSSDLTWEFAIVPLVVAFGLVRWFTTRWRISDGQIELSWGLVSKQTRTARLDKVRTVDLTAQPWHRVLGLAKVEISTAGTGDRMVLDALGLPEGRSLRSELLHHVAPPTGPPIGAPAPDGTPTAAGAPTLPTDAGGVPLPQWDAPTGTPVSQVAPGEEELLRLNPAWVRFAPLTMSGFITASVLVGLGAQLINQLSQDGQLYETVWRWAIGRGLWMGIILLLVAVSLLAIIGYVLNYWGFRLTRNPAGSLHAARGLLTTRETSLDHSRIRGVHIGTPFGLRLAGGGSLKAVSTGLREERQAASDVLTPPAPMGVVLRTAAAVVGDSVPVDATLREHGPAARRRRMTRAVVPALLLVALVAGLVAQFGWPWPWILLPAAALVLMVPLGVDRYRGLGHLVTPAHLVVSEGSLDRARVVLARDGIIGWTIRQSFFQRRAGIATLGATTAAGAQVYKVIDITLDRVDDLLTEVSPELISQFALTTPPAGPDPDAP